MADTSNLSKFLSDVAEAIRTKKEITDTIPAKDFDTEILSIQTGINTYDATASADNIEYGYTAYANGQKITGTIITNTDTVITAGPDATITDTGEALTIDRGYGEKLILKSEQQLRSTIPYATLASVGEITADKIVKGKTIFGVAGTAEGEGLDTSDATATADDIIAPKTAYVGENKVIGNIKPTYEINEVLELDFNISTLKVPEIDEIKCFAIRSNILIYSTSDSVYLLDIDEPSNYTKYAISDFGLSSISDLDINSNNTRIIVSTGNTRRVYLINYITVLFDLGATEFSRTYFNFCDAHPDIIVGSTGTYSSTSDYTYAYVFQTNQLTYDTKTLLGGSWYRIGKVTPQGSMITNYNAWYASGWSIHPMNSSGNLTNSEIVTGSETAPTYMLCSPNNKYINIDYNNTTHNFRKLSSSISSTYRSYEHQAQAMGYFLDDEHVFFINSAGVDIYNIEKNAIIKSIITSLVPEKVKFIEHGNRFINLVGEEFKICSSNYEKVLIGFERKGINYFNSSDATAVASNILTGETAYLPDGKVTGTMPNNGSEYYTPTTSNITIPQGYHNGSGYVRGDANLIAENIRKDVTIFNVTGTHDGIMTEADYNTCGMIADKILFGAPTYIPLNYIQTTGTQYIDTGVGSNVNNITIKTKVNFIGTVGGDDSFLWSSNDGDSTGLGDLYGDSLYSHFTYYYGSRSSNFGTFSYGVDYEIESIQTTNKIDTVINGTSYTLTRSASAGSNNIILFKRGSVDSYYFYGKLYYMQIYVDDVLVRDYVPAKDLLGNICLYDRVSKEFFYNKGTGSFGSGGEV